MLGLAVIASHNGTTLQAIIDACESGRVDGRVRLVLSNNSGSTALERARRHGIDNVHMSGVTHPDPEALDTAMRAACEDHGVELVCLAGYMKKVGPSMLRRYQHRILNIHPALLPKFGGQGMYGVHVHEAVIAAKETESGATLFIIDEHYDRGPIVSQASVPVLPDDTPEALAERVGVCEKELYVETLQRIALAEIDLDDVAEAAGEAGGQRHLGSV